MRVELKDDEGTRVIEGDVDEVRAVLADMGEGFPVLLEGCGQGEEGGGCDGCREDCPVKTGDHCESPVKLFVNGAEVSHLFDLPPGTMVRERPAEAPEDVSRWRQFERAEAGRWVPVRFNNIALGDVLREVGTQETFTAGSGPKPVADADGVFRGNMAVMIAGWNGENKAPCEPKLGDCQDCPGQCGQVKASGTTGAKTPQELHEGAREAMADLRALFNGPVFVVDLPTTADACAEALDKALSKLTYDAAAREELQAINHIVVTCNAERDEAVQRGDTLLGQCAAKDVEIDRLKKLAEHRLENTNSADRSLKHVHACLAEETAKVARLEELLASARSQAASAIADREKMSSKLCMEVRCGFRRPLQ